jgi:predicted nucleic acid-binding protein
VIVVDASAVVEWLLHSSAGRRIERRIYSGGKNLHAPHVLDLEVTNTFRRLVRQHTISPIRAEEALSDLLALRILRHPHNAFGPRIWQLRDNLSAYDAAYVALAERLGAVLITRDSRLASASGNSAQIELF